MLTKFLDSRRQGISSKTIEFYRSCLKPFVKNYELTSDGISSFLADLKCGNAKHAYFRAIRAFVNWLGEIQSKSVEIIGSGEYHFKLVK